MNFASFQALVIQSVRDPAAAARFLLALDLPRQTLWMALTLVAVLNTLMFSLSNLVTPTTSPIPGIFDTPIVYLGFVLGGLVLVVLSLFWTGRALGGVGRLEDILVLVVWLQGLRVLVQALVILLMVTFPLLSALVVLAAGVIGLWILAHFVDQAHRFGSLARSAGVLIAGFLAMVLGLSLFLSLIGARVIGV
ncbi:MAG: YIP1 family protein [Rhodobacteraceae bacterium]|nr:YIP1 family protein [Paracoccaceae bacterium]